MTVESWTGLNFDGDPILVVTLPGEEDLDGYQLDLTRDLHRELADIADNALEYLEGSESVPYTPYVELDDNEYLSLDRDALVVADDDEAGPGATQQQTAVLLSFVENAADLPSMGAGQLLDQLESLYCQAICRHTADGWVGFVTKSSYRKSLGRTMLPFGRDDEHDRFKKVEPPALLLERDVHAVLAPDEIAILNPRQFEFLVSDVGLVTNVAVEQVGRLATRLSAAGMPFSASARQAFEAKTQQSVQLAKRLDALCDRVTEIDVSVVLDGSGFDAQDIDPVRFINDDGEIECAVEDVRELMDALEGRFFDDALSPEKRRADRFRKR